MNDTRSASDVSSRLLCCGFCGTINRLPIDKPALQGKCGSCGKPLFTEHPIELDEASFWRHVQRDTIPVLVDMWAPWCGPCQTMAPQFKRAATQLEPEFRLLKLNIDEARNTATKLGVQGIPALLLFSNGKLVDQVAGAMSAESIVRWARSHRL